MKQRAKRIVSGVLTAALLVSLCGFGGGGTVALAEEAPLEATTELAQAEPTPSEEPAQAELPASEEPMVEAAPTEPPAPTAAPEATELPATPAPTEPPAQPTAASSAAPATTPAPVAKATATPAGTAAPAAKATATPVGTAVPVVKATATPAGTAAPTVKATATPSGTAVPAVKATATPTATATATPTATPTAEPTASPTPEPDSPLVDMTLFATTAATSPMRAAPLLNTRPSAAMFRMGFARSAAQSGQSSGLVLDKKATQTSVDADGRGTFRLDLTAYATSNIISSTAPLDVVLVLDCSGSMDFEIADTITTRPWENDTYYIRLTNGFVELSYESASRRWYYAKGSRRVYVTWKQGGDGTNNAYDFYKKNGSTRMKALKEAAKAFLDDLAQKSPESKVSIVTFAEGSQVAQGLTTVANNDVVNATLLSTISNLDADGATRADYGMASANAVLNPVAADGNGKVVVLFTDGVPTSHREFSENVANGAVAQAELLKDNYAATVYTVGVFSELNDAKSKTYQYMNHVSSNLYNCTSYTQGTWRAGLSSNDDKTSHDYFLTADSAGSLALAFTSISEQLGVKLEAATVRDYIDDRFYLCTSDGTALADGDLLSLTGEKLAQVPSGGYGVVHIPASGHAWVEWNDRPIHPESSPGANNAATFASALYVRPQANYLGGNNIPTNEDGSAVYLNSTATTPLDSFVSPHVNVPIKLPAETREKTVFLGEELDAAAMFEELETLYAGWTPSKNLSLQREGSLPATAEQEECTLTVNVSAQPENPTEDAGCGTRATAVQTQSCYRIKVVCGTLRLTKTVQGAVPSQSYIFRVTNTNTGAVFYEVFQGAGSKTVGPLCRGVYKVEELTDWSWRYGTRSVQDENDGYAANNGQDGTVRIGYLADGVEKAAGAEDYLGTPSHAAGVTIGNTLTNQTWLGDTSWTVNRMTTGVKP